MFDAPRIVVAEPVGELDLVERFVNEAVLGACVPGFGELEFVEDTESHGDTSFGRGVPAQAALERTESAARVDQLPVKARV